jgi:hypothetical protein
MGTPGSHNTTIASMIRQRLIKEHGIFRWYQSKWAILINFKMECLKGHPRSIGHNSILKYLTNYFFVLETTVKWRGTKGMRTLSATERVTA